MRCVIPPKTFVSVLAAVVLLAGVAAAQDRRYTPWEEGLTGEDAQEILGELQEMLEAAARDRAASPDFLADLEALIQRFEEKAARGPATTGPGPATAAPAPPPPETPAAAEAGTEAADDPSLTPLARVASGEATLEEAGFSTVVADAFEDGDFSAGPAWTVLQGEWEVDEEGRLRSDTRAAEGSGQIGFAAIDLSQQIPNGFLMDWVVSDLGQAGQIEARVYQTTSRDPGYRLVLTGGLAPSVTVYRSSRSGVSQLETAQITDAEPGAPLHILWARDLDRTLTVWVDGEQLISVEDTIFSDPWDGLLLGNFGGDYATEHVMIGGF